MYLAGVRSEGKIFIAKRLALYGYAQVGKGVRDGYRDPYLCPCGPYIVASFGHLAHVVPCLCLATVKVHMTVTMILYSINYQAALVGDFDTAPANAASPKCTIGCRGHAQ